MPLEYYERSQIKFYGQRIMPPSCAQSNEQSPAPPKDESSKPIADSGSMPRLSTTMPSKIEWKGVMTRGKIVLPSYSQDEKGRKEFWDDLNGGRKWFRLMPDPDYVGGAGPNVKRLSTSDEASNTFQPSEETQPSSSSYLPFASESSHEDEEKSKRLKTMTQHLRALIGIGGAVAEGGSTMPASYDLERTSAYNSHGHVSLESQMRERMDNSHVSLERQMRERMDNATQRRVPRPPPFLPPF